MTLQGSQNPTIKVKKIRICFYSASLLAVVTTRISKNWIPNNASRFKLPEAFEF